MAGWSTWGETGGNDSSDTVWVRYKQGVEAGLALHLQGLSSTCTTNLL